MIVDDENPDHDMTSDKFERSGGLA
jgi:hypothetical protein